MSSILKALKRIEGRKVDTSPPVWPYGAGNLESTNSHVYRSRQRQKILLLLIIICAVALAGKIYLGSRKTQPEPERIVIESPAHRDVIPPAPDLPEKAIATAGPETMGPIKVAPPVTPTPEPSSLTDPPEATVPEPDAPPPADIASSETKAPQVTQPPQAEPSEAKSVEEPSATAPEEIFGAPPSDNAGLSLMALVWSGQPDSRFVVINGSIVREGGSIDDTTVVRIDKDYVVMKTGGVTWKLK